MTDECQHHYVLDNIDPNPDATGRLITFHCTHCNKTNSIRTLKTDAQIQAAFDEQTADA